MKDARYYLDALSKSLKIFDTKAATKICEELEGELYATEEEFDPEYSAKIMQQLRSKRQFQLMQKLGDAFILTGRQTFKLTRLYAQAHIDTGLLTAAISVLNELEKQTALIADKDLKAQEENAEARGLLGRVYKQLYINSKQPNTKHNIRFLRLAIDYYLGVYNTDPSGKIWHGINALALSARAKRDQLNLKGLPDVETLAESVLKTIDEKGENANAWDFATAAEASIALNKPNEALEWLSGYARMPYCDAFELASTLRQLEEVWQLTLDSEMGKLLLPLLRAELLKRQGGNIILTVDEFKTLEAAEISIDASYASIEKPLKQKDEIRLEKVFGSDSFKTYKWYMLGASRALAVARIGIDASIGLGTGFLFRGKDLLGKLGDDLYLLTNAHVVSPDPAEKALKPEEVIVVFEALDIQEEFRNLEIVWYSPSGELDATVLVFGDNDQNRLKELAKDIKDYPISKYLPVVENPPSQKIYVIGNPYGGTLQLSFQDNLLIDHDRDSKIHYRTPTDGGSSGSPVFNQKWELIGLHHAGSEKMPCLNGKQGYYEANEGIWIQAIIQKMNNDLNKI